MADLLIEWTQSADDPSLAGDVVAYELARDTGPNPVAVIASIPATPAEGDTEYQETVQPGTYWYRVRAVDSAGRNSLWSEQATITVEVTTTIRHEFLVVLDHEPRIIALDAAPRLIVLDHEARTLQAGRA